MVAITAVVLMVRSVPDANRSIRRFHRARRILARNRRSRDEYLVEAPPADTSSPSEPMVVVTSTTSRRRSSKTADTGPARWPADGWSLGSAASSGPRLAWATSDAIVIPEEDLPIARRPQAVVDAEAQAKKKAAAPAPERELTPWERHVAAVAARAEAAQAAADRVKAATQTRPAPRVALHAVARPAPEAAHAPRTARPPRHPNGRTVTGPRPRPALEDPAVEWAKDRSLEPLGPRPTFGTPERRIRITGARRPLPQPGERPAERPAKTPELKPIARRISELPRHPAVAGALAAAAAPPKRAAASRSADDAARWTVLDLTASEPVIELPEVAAMALPEKAPAVLRLEPLGGNPAGHGSSPAGGHGSGHGSGHTSRVRASFPPLARRASGDGFTLTPNHSQA